MCYLVLVPHCMASRSADQEFSEVQIALQGKLVLEEQWCLCFLTAFWVRGPLNITVSWALLSQLCC